MKKLFLKIFQCWIFDNHWNITHNDNRGLAGDWICNDCGYHHKAIKWTVPPRLKK